MTTDSIDECQENLVTPPNGMMVRRKQFPDKWLSDVGRGGA